MTGTLTARLDAALARPWRRPRLPGPKAIPDLPTARVAPLPVVVLPPPGPSPTPIHDATLASFVHLTPSMLWSAQWHRGEFPGEVVCALPWVVTE